MSSSFVKLFIFLIGFYCIPAFAEDNDFWERNYQQCFQSADVVVEGKVTSFNKIEYNGNEKFGYSHYLISIDVLKPLKGFDGVSLQYHVWYEGKEHEIKGSSLFCLCKNKKGEFGDPEGFGRMSLGKHYKSYLYKLEAGNIEPIDMTSKYYVPYCSA